MLTLSRLRTAYSDMTDDDPEPNVRRTRRLRARLAEYLVNLAGRSYEDLGLSRLHVAFDDQTALMAKYANDR
jgi:hypothetical protein